MIHSHVRNRLYLVSSLCLCASFLLTGCGPASSSSGKSPESAAATQQAETVSQVTGPVPETLWDKRAEYEKEGQVVLFTDCGLYKGDTDELTGAKCEFRQGRWILLEPKLEPGDNLVQDLYSPHVHTPNTVTLEKTGDHLLNVVFDTTKGSSQIAYFVKPDSLPFLHGKKVTLSLVMKTLENDIFCCLGCGDRAKAKADVLYGKNAQTIYKDADSFVYKVSVDLLDFEATKTAWFYAVLRPLNGGYTKISIQDIFVIRGVLPMGHSR
ncbi:MAG: hypothetical protein ACE15F_23025 [bacterium]